MLKATQFDVHPVYRDRLQAMLGQVTHERDLEATDDTTVVRAERAGVTLAAAVSSSAIICDATHTGTSSEADRGLLEVLCARSIGRSVLDVGEHGALLVEHHLRDPHLSRPVRGILDPGNGDPAFQILIELTRALLANYRDLTGYSQRANFFHPEPSPGWRALPTPEKLARVRSALDQLAVEQAIPGGALQLVDVEEHWKVILDFQDKVGHAQNGWRLMELERGLRQRLEDCLRVYTTERKDLNKIRRL